MKKIVALLLSILLIFAFAACSDDKTDVSSVQTESEPEISEIKSKMEDYTDEELKLIEKIGFKPFAVNAIYSNGDFQLCNILDELALRIAFSEIDLNAYTENGVCNIPQNIVNEKAKEIFGCDFEYEDGSFAYTADGPFNADAALFKDKIAFADGAYTGKWSENTNPSSDFIYQQVYKIEEVNDAINVFFHTAFVKAETENGKKILHFYDGYNFERKSYDTEICYSDYDAVYAGMEKGNYPYLSNPEIEEFIEDFPVYVYTFEKDSSGNYTLFGFAKE